MQTSLSAHSQMDAFSEVRVYAACLCSLIAETSCLHKSAFLKWGQLQKGNMGRGGGGRRTNVPLWCTPFQTLALSSAYSIFLFLFPWKEMIEEEKIPLTFFVRMPDCSCFNREIVVSSSREVTLSEIMNFFFFLYPRVSLYLGVF